MSTMIDEATRARLDRSDRVRDAARIRGICREGELATVFQPIFELEGGTCVAFEALTRFPGEPGVPTASWFARAAEVGVGVELELAALHTALTRLDDLPEGALLSFNISPAAAVAPAFEALVGPVAERVIIELTEHERVEDYAPLDAVLTRLRERGATVAVDDVGAGFASLRHILSLAPDIVKLDLSLTREIETDPGRRALTSALVEFADGIGATIAAEGIETEGELTLLRDLGVDQGQGYYLGYPLALEGHVK